MPIRRAVHLLCPQARDVQMSNRRLALAEVRLLANALKDASIRDECSTCECYQAFLAQLEIDGTPGAIQLLRTLAVPADRIHPCLGCDPCPPAEVFAKYLGDQPRPSGKAEGGCTNGPA